MKEAQGQLAATVANANEQVSTATIDGFRQQHFAGDKAPAARDKRPDLYELSSVFVAQRQQEKQIFNAKQPELLQFSGECRPDALERS
jgi:hypothetical protein